jgi:hypothetical protein
MIATMGRRRTKNLDLPPRLHLSDGAYYYVTTSKPRRWIPLGKDRVAALVEWARIEGQRQPAEVGTLKAAWVKYEREVLPTKADRTQRDNRKEIEKLLAVFGAMQISAITPQMVRQYLDLRGQKAKIRATREKALLSHLINKAREWGLTESANPCVGIRGWAAKRDRYITDEEFSALYAAACQPLRDALDLALLTGQRPADVLKMDQTMVRDGAIWVRQGKTGKKLRILIQGQLASVIDRCKARAKTHAIASLYLLNNERGQRYTTAMLREDFEAARAAAKIPDIQFRDLRAKAATDSDSLEHAQSLLGHAGRAMTEHYVKDRAGDVVRPLR